MQAPGAEVRTRLRAVRVKWHPAQQTYICTQHHYTCLERIWQEGRKNGCVCLIEISGNVMGLKESVALPSLFLAGKA